MLKITFLIPKEKLKYKTCKGFTLIELLVVLTIAAILLSSLIAAYLGITQKNEEATNTTRLDQMLRASLTSMANDIRRAGFWGNASTDIHTGNNTNPFMTNDISINPAGNCILFTYDRDGNGSLPSISTGGDDERYGFRLLNGAIQARPAGAAFDCTASANAWENITDPNSISITQLNFVKTDKNIDIDGEGGGTAMIQVRTVDITVTGQLVSNANISKTLTEQIRVRNDKYIS